MVGLVKNFTRSPELVVEGSELLSRAELERKVLIDLLERDVRYRPESEQWANLTLTLKQLALTGANPNAILTELDHQIRAINQPPAVVA